MGQAHIAIHPHKRRRLQLRHSATVLSGPVGPLTGPSPPASARSVPLFIAPRTYRVRNRGQIRSHRLARLPIRDPFMIC